MLQSVTTRDFAFAQRIADAYATAMYAMGPVLATRFATALAEAGPYQSMIVARDGQEFGTPGLAAHSGAGTLLAG